jgi:hypothetical protein
MYKMITGFLKCKLIFDPIINIENACNIIKINKGRLFRDKDYIVFLLIFCKSFHDVIVLVYLHMRSLRLDID